MKRPLIKNTETVVDLTTGEVAQQTTYEKKVVKDSFEPDYVKLYISDVINLAEEIKTTRVDVLYMLLSFIDYHNEIALMHDRREDICDSCNITMPYLKKVLKEFLDKQVLLNKYNKAGEKVRGIYIANPHFFGRGKWEDIFNLRLTITYDAAQKRFIQVERNPEKQGVLPLEQAE